MILSKILQNKNDHFSQSLLPSFMKEKEKRKKIVSFYVFRSYVVRQSAGKLLEIYWNLIGKESERGKCL